MTIPYKKIELLANVAIIILVLLFGAIVARSYFSPNSPTSVAAARAPVIKPGTKISLAEYDWSVSERSLVMVLSKDCRFCTESAAFYQRLAKARNERKDLRFVAVLPQSLEEGRQYLARLGFAADEVKQASPATLGATGTPTLILVDKNGVAVNSWIGKLPASIEAEVLNMLNF